MSRARHPSVLGLSRRELFPAALLPLVAERVGQAAPLPQPRFLYLHTPNGFLRSGFTLERNLTPLARWKDRLAIVTGLCNKSAAPGGGPQQIVRLLTCKSADKQDEAGGQSFDWALALALGEHQEPITAAVLPTGPLSHWATGLSWKGKSASVPPVSDPATLWDRVAVSRPWQTNAARRRQVTSAYVDRELDRAWSRLGPAAGGKTLDRHKTAVAKLAAEAREQAGCPRPSFTRATLLGLDRTVQAQGRGALDVILTAFGCGLARVATLQWQPAGGGRDPLAGPDGDLRAHFALTRRTDADAMARWGAIDRFYAGEMAWLLDQLAARALLDDTIVCWGSEVGRDGAAVDLAFVVAAGPRVPARLGGRVLVEYPVSGALADPTTPTRPENRGVADLWMTIAHLLLGAPLSGFGNPAAFNDLLKEILP